MKTSRALPLMIVAALAVSAAGRAAAQVTDAQACEAAVERASGDFLSCRLKVEAVFATNGDAAKRGSKLAKCDGKRTSAFLKALLKRGEGDCPSTSQTVFAGYLTKCADDAVEAARGGDLVRSCGDGHLNVAGEQCDGADLGGESCAALGHPGGTLACTEDCRFDVAACSTGDLAASGATTCWGPTGTAIACAGTGQDGEFQAGATQTFRDNGDGTIVDEINGLQWEKLGDDGGAHDKDTLLTWADAFARVAALNASAFAGHDDWRLPNIRELASISDFEQSGIIVAPVFTAGCVVGCEASECSCTGTNGPVWSSTSHAVQSNRAWALYFSSNFETSSPLKSSVLGTRAVRSLP